MCVSMCVCIFTYIYTSISVSHTYTHNALFKSFFFFFGFVDQISFPTLLRMLIGGLKIISCSSLLLFHLNFLFSFFFLPFWSLSLSGGSLPEMSDDHWLSFRIWEWGTRDFGSLQCWNSLFSPTFSWKQLQMLEKSIKVSF